MIGWLAAAVLALLAHHAFWRRRYAARRWPDERHFARTADGWTLAVSRLRPRGAEARGAPVILCPGLACNHRLFDLDDQLSLGGYLARRGFDVFMMDPRGTGESERAGLRPRRWRYGFPEYVQQDAPAVIEKVRALTGAERVSWVGHSMGGLIGYHVGAQTEAGRAVSAVAALGSPADFSRHPELLGVLEGWLLDWFFRWWPVVRLGRLCTVIAPLAGWLRRWPETIFVSPDNVRPAVLRRFMVQVVEDVPRRLLDHFADAVHRGRGLDGQPVAASRAELARLDPPVLAISGDRDGVAPDSSVRAATDILRSAEVRHVQMNAAEHGAHFGHLDLLVGERAPHTVYPLVADFLLAHLGPAARGPGAD